MAVILEGGCCVSEFREGGAVVNGTLRVWNQIGRATGAEAISMSVMEFAPGLSPGIVNDDCDEILYVLSISQPARDYDRVAVGDSSQGQAQSAPPLDQTQLEPTHPEGVRERKRVARIH